MHFLESDWEIKNGERKLRSGVIPQPANFKKHEDDTATRKRKANPRYSADEPNLKQAKKLDFNNELEEARLEISRKELRNKAINVSKSKAHHDVRKSVQRRSNLCDRYYYNNYYYYL